MKEIRLTKGQVALVDDADYESVSSFTWYAHRYKNGSFYASRHSPRNHYFRKNILMHRQLLGLEASDGRYVDHKNGNGLDNRRSNLRIVNRSQNQWNTEKQRNNKSGHKGVFWYKRSRKWRAKIMVHGKTIELGLFTEVESAAAAYNAAAAKYHGEFRREVSA